MTHPFFFGYGSLVNRRTHTYAPAHPARITGWRRAWRATNLRQVAFLTAVQDPGAETEGLIAAVPDDDWTALDAREAAYERHEVTHTVVHKAQSVRDIAVYAIEPERVLPPSDAHPILLSYIDVVVQGFLAEYGSEGAERFFATTVGWDTPILNDRAAPRYPRAQKLHDGETAVVDAALARLKCRVIDVE